MSVPVLMHAGLADPDLAKSDPTKSVAAPPMDSAGGGDEAINRTRSARVRHPNGRSALLQQARSGHGSGSGSDRQPRHASRRVPPPLALHGHEGGDQASSREPRDHNGGAEEAYSVGVKIQAVGADNVRAAAASEPALEVLNQAVALSLHAQFVYVRWLAAVSTLGTPPHCAVAARTGVIGTDGTVGCVRGVGRDPVWTTAPVKACGAGVAGIGRRQRRGHSPVALGVPW